MRAFRCRRSCPGGRGRRRICGTTMRRMRLPSSPPGGHRAPDGEREPDHGAGVWFSLLLVAVQDAGREVAGQDACELPRQVHRVAQAGAHALPDERRSEVGGVAEQKDVAASPSVGELGPEGVLGRRGSAPARRRRTCVGPRRDQWFERRQARRSRRRSHRAAAGTPTGSGYGRCACRWPRGPGRTPGARRPTGRGRRRWRRRRPASVART